MNLKNVFPDLKQWFTHYFVYKVVALILAVVVYLYVNGEFK
jgi:YbbR domain-containing protein